MSLRNDNQLANTKRKLTHLDRLIDNAKKQPGPGRDAEVRSLSRLANELREEIARYEAGSPAAKAG